MNIQLYDKITLLCMATAVSSAVLFDRIEPYGWVAAVLGIGSASVSIVIYLFLREREADEDVSETESGDGDVALSGHPSRTSALLRVPALPHAYGGSYDANARLEVSPADSPATVVAAADAESTRGQVAFDLRESVYLVDPDQWAGSAWMIMEIGDAEEPHVRVHINRQKRTSFDDPHEARFGRTPWHLLWIEVLMAPELPGLSRAFRKESRRQKPFASPEALSVLPSLKERRYH